MSSKFLYALKDENPDLHKQIGCMNGLFRLFHRHHSLADRRISSHNHMRLPPAGQGGNNGIEPNRTTLKAMEKNPREVTKEKQRVSVESSRTSFSSSSSSTFSSVDCNKTAHPEPAFLGYSISSETPSHILPKKQSNSSLHSGWQSLDLRDVVKDSIYRETCGLSVKTTTTAEGKGHAVKHIDSPRPQQLSKSVKPKVSGPDLSFRVLAKLQEAPRITNKEKPQAPLPKDAPRFSYDERESRDRWKSAIKLKELPRLSLDSREGSIRRSATESRSNSLLDDLQQGDGKLSQTANPHEEPGSNKRPSSSIVAKLMGLEAFPDSMPANSDQMRKIKCCKDEVIDAKSTSSRKASECKHNQVSRSPRIPQGEPASPQIRKNNPEKPSSRFPLEAAPWRHPDGNRGSQKPAFIHNEAHTIAQNSCPSVYGEFEKKLTELEFKRSGKDLRALKQIIEAMQNTRETLEKRREEHFLDLEGQTSNYSPNCHNLDQNAMLTMQHRQQGIHQIAPTIKGTGPSKKFESPVVIIKPAKIAHKPKNSDSPAIPIEGISGLRKLRTSNKAVNKKDLVDKQTAKDLTPRNNRFRESSSQPLHCIDRSANARMYRSSQTSKAPSQMSGVNPTSSASSVTTVSPRMRQKKHGMENHSCPPTKASDSRRAVRRLSKQQTESGSQSRNFKSKSPNFQHCNDQLSEISSETRHLSYHSDAISVQSESNVSLASQTETEVMSIDLSKEINSAYQSRDQKIEIAARLSEGRSKGETAAATLEQPSPVSVLDTTFYTEESPSPVKKISNAFKVTDEETVNSDEAEWNSVGVEYLLNSTRPSLGSEFDQEKLENVKHLVHKLRQVNSTHDEAATDYIASLCDNTNPDHRYVTEILLASGLLLKDLGSSSTFIQLHPSGHLINPNLFLVLEQTNGRIEFPDDKHSNEKIDQSKFRGKIHRKIIFDTINEILVYKLTSTGFFEPWNSPSKVGVKSLTGQRLLKELCSEIDHLQANADCSFHDEDGCLISILNEDMMHQRQNWVDYHSEIPGVVLDIERLIFKDLIGEVVSGLPGRPRKHCRELFSK